MCTEWKILPVPGANQIVGFSGYYPLTNREINHIVFYFDMFPGVQTTQGPGQDGPTVTDITTGESMVTGNGNMDGREKMSSVLPTMWLGAQSGW